jgi:hypothetical protein
MSLPPLSFACTGYRRWRPPKVELRFDVIARNDTPVPRWAIVPDALPRGLDAAASTRVYSIDLYELAGTGRVVVAHFIGDHGFFALLVPGSAELRLIGMPISYWGELPGSIEIESTTATALLVDGHPVEGRLGLDPASEPGAEADAGPLASQASVVWAIAAPEGGALVAEWHGGQAMQQRVELEPAVRT